MKSILFLLSGICSIASAQTTIKVVDAATSEPIPYASISVNQSENHISNDEGYFTVSEANSKPETVVLVTFFGYGAQQHTLAELQNHDLTVKLKTVIFELDEVNVSGPPSPESIMAEVKRNLERNYGGQAQTVKEKIFVRESASFVPKTLDLEITKSTGFSKQALREVNADVSSLTSRLVAQPPREYTDVLADYYSAPAIATANGPVPNAKLDVVKATKLQDENRSMSLEDMQQTAANLFLKHLDTTKYYRFKSGWFGSNDTISLKKDRKKKTVVRNELSAAKSGLSGFLADNNLLRSARLNFVKELELYRFAYEGSVYLENGNYAYVLTFEPRKSKAKYKGKLYVSQSDYAVVRADYELAEGKKLGGINLKLILGVKAAENLSSGTLIYKPDPHGDGYYLQYGSEQKGQYMYVNRPVKFIELTNAARDVVAFDLKIEGDMLEKTEFLNVKRSEIAKTDFDSFKEQEFAYQRITRYDPKLWKDSASIEPLSEMKRYAVANEAQ